MPVRSETALVIDALPGPGGAEKVLIEAMKLFPDAPIYTLIYNHEAFAETPLRDRQVISSNLNRLPWKHTQYRKYLPLMPSAIERFDLSRYERIISFSYAVAHGIRVQSDQKHLSYTFTPMRYAWRNFGLDGMTRPANPVLNWLLHRFRAWDLSTIAHIDHLAAVSHWIAQCVEKAYGRQATVIYPPVEIERFSPDRKSVV